MLEYIDLNNTLMLCFFFSVLTNAHANEVSDDSLAEDVSQLAAPNVEDIHDLQATCSATNTAMDTVTQNKEKVVPNKKKVTTQDAVLKALKERKEERELLMKTVETAFQPVVEKEDEIDHFFKSIALTVKKFSPAEKVETKMKVMEVVTAIEMRRFSNTNNQVVYPNYNKPHTNQRSGSSLSTSSIIGSAMQCLSPDDMNEDLREYHQQ